MDEDQYLAIGVILIIFGIMFICAVTYLYFIIKDCLNNRSNIKNIPNIAENMYEEIM